MKWWRRDPTIEAFWALVQKGKLRECWNWKGETEKGGYGKFPNPGKEKRAHRFSYQLHYGRVPPGLFVCHRCDNPTCVNPNHLYAGTAFDNARDASVRGRMAGNNALIVVQESDCMSKHVSGDA